MNHEPQRRQMYGRLRRCIGVVLVFSAGCAGGQGVTPEAVDRARQLWERAGITDYDLDYSVKGRTAGHYFVTVRGGQVCKLELVQRDGSKVELRHYDPRYYGVDGLFRTIADELALLKADQPFGQPSGTKIAMRFQPDAQLGYPHFYRRDVLGTTLSISLDVSALIPARTPSMAVQP
jgi:hypothetical protein